MTRCNCVLIPVVPCGHFTCITLWPIWINNSQKNTVTGVLTFSLWCFLCAPPIVKRIAFTIPNITAWWVAVHITKQLKFMCSALWIRTHKDLYFSQVPLNRIYPFASNLSTNEKSWLELLLNHFWQLSWIFVCMTNISTSVLTDSWKAFYVH